MTKSWVSKNPLKGAVIIATGALFFSVFASFTPAEGQSKKRKNVCVVTQQVVTPKTSSLDKETYVRGVFEVENRDSRPQLVSVNARFLDPKTRKVIGEWSGYEYVGGRQKTFMNSWSLKAPADFSGSAQVNLKVGCEQRRDAQVITAEGKWGDTRYGKGAWTFSFRNNTRLTVPSSAEIEVALYERETGKLVDGCSIGYPLSTIEPGYGFDIESNYGSGGCSYPYLPYLPKEENQYLAIARVGVGKS